MTITAFLLILASVALHACWNLLSKANHPSISFYAVFCFAAGAMLIPAFPAAQIDWTALDASFWRPFAFSVAVEIIYSIGLAYAYRYGDVSMAYPVSRSLPVIFTAAVTCIFNLGERPAPLALTGMAIVAVGCFILPQPKLKNLSWKCFATPALLPIMAAALGTTGYTIADSIATQTLLDANPNTRTATLCVYLCLIQLAMCIGLIMLLCIGRIDSRATFMQCLKSPWPYLCGIFSCTAYLLVLFAMQRVTNVSFLQAFRQMSLPLGVFAGIYFLKERFTVPKIIGTAFILIGLMLTVL